jgi:DNA-binding MarR family transcriptional regulator
MTRPYQVGGQPNCTLAPSKPALPAAGKWLATLRDVTAAQAAVLTPYADVDMTALVHQGLTGDLATAYRTGDAVAADVLHAFSLALHPVFLASVPLALIAFVLSWLLPQVRLRGAATAADLGEGLGGAPTERTSADDLELALSRLSAADLRRAGYDKLAAASGLAISGGAAWVLTRLGKQGTLPGDELARQARVPVECDELVSRGYVERTPGGLALTVSGRAAADQVFATQRSWLRSMVDDWSPEQHAELAALLTKLSRAMLGSDSDQKVARV